MPFRASGRGAYGPQGQRVIKGPLAPVWVNSSPPASSGGAYSYQFLATDDSGDAPTYSLASGSVPGGLSLSSSGLLSGTANVAGTFTFDVRATDVNGRFTDSGSRSITVTLRAPATYTVSQAASLGSYVANDVINIGFTGGEQTINRFNATSWRVQLFGGSGSDGDSSNRAGGGGRVNGDMTSLGQSAYYVHIGGAGARGNNVNGIGGYNGGGNVNGDSNTSWFQSGGGGASDIRTVQGAWNANTSNRVLVAGGGGAGSRNGGSGQAGPGAYPNGVQSSQDGGNGTGSNANGRGGTQNAGGDPGANGSINSLISAGFNQGGGYNSASNVLSGAGGSGWYGGGVGSFHMGLGGGGSSYFSGAITNFGHTTGTQGVSATNGSGSITILTVS
jgi:hypothetical protein